jgi:hypothetical protein
VGEVPPWAVFVGEVPPGAVIVGEVPLEVAGAVFVADVAAVGIVADVPPEVVASDAAEAEEDGDVPEMIDVELVVAVDGASDVGDSVAVVGEDASAAEVVGEVGWMVVSGVVESVSVVGDSVSVVGDSVSVVGDSVSVVGNSVSVVGNSVSVVISAAAVGINVPSDEMVVSVDIPDNIVANIVSSRHTNLELVAILNFIVKMLCDAVVRPFIYPSLCSYTIR